MTYYNPEHDSYHKSIEALTLVQETELETLLSEREALRAWEDLRRLPTSTRERIHAQVETVEFDLITKLKFDEVSGTYSLTGNELRYVLSRMAITAAAQEAVDIGSVILDISKVRSIVEGPDANGDGGEDLPPSAER